LHLTYQDSGSAPNGDRPTLSLIPDAKEAFADLRELIELAGRYPDVDLGIEFSRLAEQGLPALCGEIDTSLAIPAGHAVFRYKLPERLHELLSTLRARNVDVDNLESGSGVVHGDVPSKIEVARK